MLSERTRRVDGADDEEMERGETVDVVVVDTCVV